MIESVSHLFSSTTCAATHVDGEGGESDLLQQIQMSVQKPVMCGGRQVTWSGQTECLPLHGVAVLHVLVPHGGGGCTSSTLLKN